MGAPGGSPFMRQPRVIVSVVGKQGSSFRGRELKLVFVFDSLRRSPGISCSQPIKPIARKQRPEFGINVLV